MQLVARNSANPRAAWGNLAKGAAIHGLTDGTWSFTDALEEIVGRWGPGELIVSTWNVEKPDAARVREWLDRRRIGSVRFLLDFSFRSRRSENLDEVRRLFGERAVRMWSCHAKFAALVGGRLNILYLSSANMNRNPRVENYSLFVGGEIPDEYVAVCDSLFASQAAGAAMKGSHRVGKDAHKAVLGPAGSRLAPKGDSDLALLAAEGSEPKF